MDGRVSTEKDEVCERKQNFEDLPNVKRVRSEVVSDKPGKKCGVRES